MAHLVSVSQLGSLSGKSFLNVTEGYDLIGVWGSYYKRPTYLIQDEFQFHLMQFDNQEAADKWLNENKSPQGTVMKLSGGGNQDD